MKITIEEKDKLKAKRILAADDAFSLLWDIDQKCREVIKYQNVSEETANKIQEIRDMIWEDNILELFD